MIDFNVSPYLGNELRYVAEAVTNHKICGDGPFTKRCHNWIEQRTGAAKALLTTSGTSALEMAALLCGFRRNEEVILPSFTFSSTANAFVLAGARLVFVDVRPDTMNIDEAKIEDAINERTRAICVVHYAGVSCEMDAVTSIARRYGLMVIEDAAQGVMSTYNGRALGAIGDFGCYSFHETKNYSMGEGGALIIKNRVYIERAEVLREKGTDRSRFLRGQVDKYTWQGYGSSYLPSDINAAYLWGQLENADAVNANRLGSWKTYDIALRPLAERGFVELPHVPKGCVHNAHMYWLKAADLVERTALINHLRQNDVYAVFHYVPLHSAPAGLRYGRFHGVDEFTTRESNRLLRLPMYYGLKRSDLERVVDAVYSFYGVAR